MYVSDETLYFIAASPSQPDRQTDRQMEEHTERKRQMHGHRNKGIETYTHVKTNSLAVYKTDRQTDRQTDRHFTNI